MTVAEPPPASTGIAPPGACAAAAWSASPARRPATTLQLLGVNLTTRTILQRVADGEAGAVNECLDRFGDLVWSLARRYLRNAADAEDAVQEIFIEIWSSAGRYDPAVAKEATFIAMIARRRLIDRIRRIGRQPLMASMDDDEGAPVDPGVAATVEEETDVAIVSRVLSKMDPEHRKVLAMSLYEGYSHSEIADELAMPLGTVKTWVRRGLIHIREQLQVGVADAGSVAE